MRFYVIKLKHVIFGVIAAVALAAVCIRSGPAVSTFLVSGRELPIYSVERKDNRIALTFDCAWNDDDIDDIISALKRYDCKATFFVTGKWAEDYSSSLNKLYREGFEIGIHSYNHDDYTTLSSDEILRDMAKCDAAVLRATGFKPTLARVPSGAYDDNAVRTIENDGRICVQWSVDGIDYPEGVTAEQIYNRIVPEVRAGDIILLHNGTEHTAEVLPRILEQLEKEYEPVNVSDLIYKEDYTLDHAGKQHPGNLL